MARLTPLGSGGQAAGTAAAIAHDGRVFVDIGALQALLRSDGALLDP
jgi:hypothetical protein